MQISDAITGMIYGYAPRFDRRSGRNRTGAPVEGGRVREGVSQKITGTTPDRLQLAKLMKALAPGDVVITPAVDRLSRDTTDLLVIARDAARRSRYPFTRRALPRYDLGLCRDRLCDPWCGRYAGAPPHLGAYRARTGRCQTQWR
jgi:resolvase-like protein